MLPPRRLNGACCCGTPTIKHEPARRPAMHYAVDGTHLLIQDVDKSFGTKHVLSGITLEAQRGEFIAIVGKSGCGKSTLLRLLAGLDKPDQGGICVDGQPLNGLNTVARVMFQDARLLPWKRVLDNI